MRGWIVKSPGGWTTRAIAALCLVLVLVLGVAGCGSSDSGSSSPETGGGEAGSTGEAAAAETDGGSGDAFTQASLEKRMSQLYKSSFTAPPKQSPPPKPANITMVTAGLSFSAGADAAHGVQEAGEALGWNVNVVDGKFDTNTELNAIRQAVVNHVDGIIIYLIDCPTVQAGLQQAKQAGIPVVGIESFDCSDLKAGGEELLNGAGKYNAAPYGPPVEYTKGWIDDWARSTADALIAGTDMKAKVIEAFETDSEGTIRMHEGYSEEMAKCAECETVETVEYTGADFGPNLQQKIAQALLQHPEANAVYGGYDAPVVGGIAAAVRASGRLNDLYVTGGEGHKENVALVRDDKGQNAGSGSVIQWEAWGGVDSMNRVLNGQEPTTTGIGIQVWDKEHNMPGPGEAWEPDVDFRKLYREAWGVE